MAISTSTRPIRRRRRHAALALAPVILLAGTFTVDRASAEGPSEDGPGFEIPERGARREPSPGTLAARRCGRQPPGAGGRPT